MTSHSLDDGSPHGLNTIPSDRTPPGSAGPQHIDATNGPRGIIRRHSSISVHASLPELSSPSSTTHTSSPLWPQQLVGDNATRPHFLKERSITMYQHVSTTPTQPSGVQSRASSFLVGLVEKSRTTTSPFESKSSVATSNLYPQPKDDHTPSTPASTPSLTSQTSRRKSMLTADGSHIALVGRLQQHTMGLQSAPPVPRKATLHSIGSGHTSLPSAHEEGDEYLTEDDFTARSTRDLVKDLTLYKKRSEVLLRMLNEIHRRLQHADMVCSTADDVDGATLCKDLVEDGLLAVVAQVLREFRFHVELQTAAVSLLSHVADMSDLYAYMMVELDVEPVVQKAVAVHVSQERLVMAGSSLCRAIAEAKHKTDVAKLLRARAVEKERKRTASVVEAFAAELIAARSRASLLRVSKSAARPQGGASEDELPQRRLPGSSPGHRVPTRRAMTAKLGAPPTLDSHYQLELPATLHCRRRVSAVPPLSRVGSANGASMEAAVCAVARPVTSPDPVMRASSSSLEAVYLQSPVFVVPSPLGTRMEMRKSLSAVGMKKKAASRGGLWPQVGGRNDRMGRDEGSQSQQVEEGTRRGEDGVWTSAGDDDADHQGGRVVEEGSDGSAEESSRAVGEGRDEDQRADGGQHSEEEEDDSAYDDDFAPEDDEEEPTEPQPERLLPVGSDSELIDLVASSPVDEVDPYSGADSSQRDREELPPDSGRLLGTGSDSELVAMIDAMQDTRQDETVLQADGSSAATEDSLTVELVGILSSCVQSTDPTATPHRVKARDNVSSTPKGSQVRKKKAPPASPLAATWTPPPTVVRPVSRRIMDKSYKATRRKSPGKSKCSVSVSPSTVSSTEASTQITAILKKIDTSDAPEEDQQDEDVTPAVGLVQTLRSAEKTLQRLQTTASTVAQIQALYARGLQLHKTNDLAGAIRCYEQGIALQKSTGIPREFASLYINLGSAKIAQSKLTEALRAFEEAERIQPHNVKAVFNTALALVQLERLDEAAERLARVVASNPEHLRAQSLLNECRRDVAKMAEQVES